MTILDILVMGCKGKFKGKFDAVFKHFIKNYKEKLENQLEKLVKRTKINKVIEDFDLKEYNER